MNRFYSYQRLVREKVNCYINEESLSLLGSFHDPTCQEYSLQEQSIFLKMSQMLAQHFLALEFDLGTLTSVRIKKEGSKLNHLRMRR